MTKRMTAAAAALAALTVPHLHAQGTHMAGPQPAVQPGPDAAPAVCHLTHPGTLVGTVRDSTQALIPGARLTLEDGRTVLSGEDGRFRFACLASGAHQLVATADGFSANQIAVTLPRAANLGDMQIILQPEAVATSIDVSAADQTLPEAGSAGATETLSGKQLDSLADDPDDLLRELQQLGAAAGGSPANVTITVDGFQDASKLPPKASIAYIKVNPDQFSAEYREPPFDGARVEVYTRPGQSTFHGALFATNGSPWENARDPFSPGKAALGKQRYGFELTGPVHKGADFALDLEHRIINNFGVVNAVTLSGPTTANVPTPQHLWIGEARLDWQLGAKNTFITSYTANVNNLENVGVGGTNLAETGYNSNQYDHTLRFTDVFTVTPHLMHEARVAFEWVGENDLADSTAPQVQVAGFFTGGGATTGNQRIHQLRTEIDDDIILTTKAHNLKVGTQMFINDRHNQATTNFNGTYIFGGGTGTLTGLDEFRLGVPTAFSNVSGTPAVHYTLLRDAFYIQDDWKLPHGIQLSGGMRYFFELNPTVLAGATPRFGVLWSPSKKNTWTLHAHIGLFTGQFGTHDDDEVYREDGVQRITSTVYNPVYCTAPGCNPFAGTTPIRSVRQYSPHLTETSWGGYNFGGTRTLPGNWNVSADFYNGRMWNDTRSVNVNAPIDGNPYGTRALGVPNLDVLQMNNSGQGNISAEFVGIEQHSLKHVQLFFGGVRVELVDDTDDNDLNSPQSSFSDAGEFAHRTGQPTWNLFGNASFNLPEKIVLSGNFNAGGDAHYNILTGNDNNGDGNFNDRPQYALPGTPDALNTPFGLLVAQGGQAVFPRNKGVMPWTFYLDTNIQRAFTLTRNPKADHQQTLTVNIRSSNVLNHTNVTAVGGVLGSSLFTVPYQADPGRRVEAGLRYSF